MNKAFLLFISSVLLSSSALAIDDASALKILKSARCTTCHSVDDDKIGPSYKSVGQRYASPDKATKAYLKGQSPTEYLIHKVRVGTNKNNKNWVKSAKGKRFGIMTKNAKSKISDSDLKTIVEYILSLK